MECKFLRYRDVQLRNQELIDTLWNVNEDNSTPVSDFHTELIDTLWNVNTILHSIR